MSDLVVVAYPDEYRAAEVLATLMRLQTAYAIDLEDAAYVTKDAAGKLKLHQNVNLTGAGAVSGAMWGALIGLLFLAPVAGMAIGAASGALTGKLSDYGISDQFAKDLGARLGPGSSAVFVLVRKVTADKVVPEVSKFGGTVMQTSLSAEAEARLQVALTESTPE